MDTAALLNEQFLDKWDTAEGKEKLGSYQADYVKDRIREEGFSSKILSKKTVTRADLIPALNNDTMVKRVQTAPYSRAMTASFSGKPAIQYISAPRFDVPFFRVQSLRYEKRDVEIMAYDIPITKIVHDQIGNDIQEIEDRQLLTMLETACQMGQKVAQSEAPNFALTDAKAFTARNVKAGQQKEVSKCKSVDAVLNTTAANDSDGVKEHSGTIFPIQKDDLTKLFKLFVGSGSRGSRMQVDKFMLTDFDFEDLNLWSQSDVGDKIAGETTVGGFKYQTLVGRKYFRTLKTDILRPGNVYAFAEEEYLGGSMVLNKLQFYTDKKDDLFSFMAAEDIAFYIGNVYGVRKLELYQCSAETLATGQTDNATARGNFAPKSEEELGKLNNLVDQDGVVPVVSAF